MTTPDLDAIREQWLAPCGPCDAGLAMQCTHPDADERPVIAALCDEVERLRAVVDDARQVVRRLVHMEREQLGTGPEGHLSERDLAPLLHALHIDPEETDRG